MYKDTWQIMLEKVDGFNFLGGSVQHAVFEYFKKYSITESFLTSDFGPVCRLLNRKKQK